MKFNKSIFKLANCLAWVLFLAFTFMGANAQATVVNFDSVDASQGSVDAVAYMASYGITLSNQTPGLPISWVILDERNYTWTTASTPHNYFTFWGTEPYYQKYTMIFSVPVNNISFDWVAITSETSIPWWKATAYDGFSNPVSSVEESSWGGTRGVTTFTLNGNDIRYIAFESNADGYAAMGSPLIDTLSYTSTASTPIPGAVWLLGSGLLGLGAVGWRRRQA